MAACSPASGAIHGALVNQMYGIPLDQDIQTRVLGAVRQSALNVLGAMRQSELYIGFGAVTQIALNFLGAVKQSVI